jgi:hypothetical protein
LTQPFFARVPLRTVGIDALKCVSDNRSEQRSCDGDHADDCSVHAASLPFTAQVVYDWNFSMPSTWSDPLPRHIGTSARLAA